MSQINLTTRGFCPIILVWEPARRPSLATSLLPSANESNMAVSGCGDLRISPSLPFTAVAQSLSRLTRGGVLQRLSKGVYYRPRQTPFGTSRPNPAAIHKLATRRKKVYPSGITAANLLGFTTQNARTREVATSSLSLPRKLIGRETIVHCTAAGSVVSASELDAALLDFLRRRGETSELPPEETVRRLLALLSEKGRFERLLAVSHAEPPRVRAILGAAGEQLGKPPKTLQRLRATLNPFSRFDFGVLAALDRAGALAGEGAPLA